ncbi:MAG: tetratricopeptide repeat protein [Planctomycetota bacterium]|nr:tetratricopeptide repeat protein [Planctomycetota bacterium]
MSRRLLTALAFVTAAAVLSGVAACTSQEDSNPKPPAPDVPDPDLSDMEPRVAALLRRTREAVISQPESADAWGKFGAACDAHELYDHAAICYRIARALAPADVRWPYHLAIIRESQNAEVDEIISLLNEAAQISPDYPTIYFRMGEVLARQGRLKKAVGAYEKALELDPDLAIAHRSLGQILISLNDINSALEHLKRAAQLAPNDGPLFAALAQGYMRSNDSQRAEEAVSKSRRLSATLAVPDPLRFEVVSMGTSSELCRERADRFLVGRDFAGAIPDLMIVAEVRPEDAAIQRKLGTAYMYTGRSGLARKHLNEALHLDHDLISAHSEMGVLLLSEGLMDDAIQHLRRALDRRPDQGPTRALLATALARRGDLDQAIAEFERSVEHSAIGAQAQLNWGTALMQRGDHLQAVERFREVIRLMPRYAMAHFNLGLALESLGRREEAAVHFRRSLDIEPNQKVARRLAKLESALGGPR